jgi:hypothetical protein
MNIYTLPLQIYTFILILNEKFENYLYFCSVNDFYIIILYIDEKEIKTY